ncbi:diacylglycerol kinase family protein [candidate division WWE3 bacterium]|jgi:diacylglycerol kinase (ATP)|uniref:Diacylglycerol kinase family protein n=1 Tax=candidate division WWE3 bacterium TaxID=2053526 RepID=A0A3A4ZIW0_UNCKA|nr:MAG: diacylglycerol kinase family protein [candidate division WWE3 bacterium]
MKQILNSHHPVRHAKSFKYAFEGIFHALLNEANFRIQVLIAVISVIAGIHFNISNTEWGLLTISMGFLLSAEMLNTVVEEFIDNIVKEENVGMKIIKDCAAGFVLITAITVALILFLIFGHRLV